MRKSGKRTLESVREMLEVVLGLGGVAGVSWWIPVAWRPSHLLFCAFFIVVFAIAVRYRVFVAYSASMLASCTYGMLLWVHPEMRMHPNFLALALEPFLLLVSGVLTSDLLRWQRQRLIELEQEYACVDETLQRTEQSYQLAVMTNKELERQIAGQSISVATMSDKVTRLWKLDGVERYGAILDLVIYAIEAQSCAFYLWQKGWFYLLATRSDETSVYAPRLNSDDPLLKRVIAQREVVTIRDSLAEEKLLSPGVGVMAGPLLNQAGEVIGVVVINHMPLVKFTPGAVCLFRALLHLSSIALQTVQEPGQRQHHARHRAVLDSDATEPFLPVVNSSNAFIQ